MTLERGWKARQEAALRKASMRDKMHELNRARASVIGNQVNPMAIVPVQAVEPAPAPTPVTEPEDDDQFDPTVDVKPEPKKTAPRPKK